MYSSIATNLSSVTKAILVAAVIVAPGINQPAVAADKGTSATDAPRDMNMFQVEPTVIDERYYTSGRAERHQKTSPTLPEGSPIPDNYTGTSYPYSVQGVPGDAPKTEVKKDAVKSSVETTGETTSTSSGKIEPSVLSELNSIKPGEKRFIKLRLNCSTIDPTFLKTVKAVKSLKVVSVDKDKNEVVVEAQISTVSEIEAMKEITKVSTFQSK
ncbi:hypothetical protein KF728_28550 [Candidatus Obscuribacterales bacterium]|nr:hypothetical protein [Candidatus Obscuribacterales bacterium]